MQQQNDMLSAEVRRIIDKATAPTLGQQFFAEAMTKLVGNLAAPTRGIQRTIENLNLSNFKEVDARLRKATKKTSDNILRDLSEKGASDEVLNELKEKIVLYE